MIKERFDGLWQRLGAGAPPDVDPLLARYNEKNRHYHNLDHLTSVLAMVDLAKGALEKSGEIAHLSVSEKQKLFDTIELALWYHDAVYDATQKDNEDKSRDLFLSDAQKAGLAPALQNDVARLIMITKHHKDATQLDERILTDCDLAILGADAATFKKYDDDIRREYAHVPAPAYKIGRRQVLGGFLVQKPIFKTAAFREQFEDRAQDNLRTATATPMQRILRKFSR